MTQLCPKEKYTKCSASSFHMPTGSFVRMAPKLRGKRFAINLHGLFWGGPAPFFSKYEIRGLIYHLPATMFIRNAIFKHSLKISKFKKLLP